MKPKCTPANNCIHPNGPKWKFRKTKTGCHRRCDRKNCTIVINQVANGLFGEPKKKKK